jgi:hypothetical protein
MTDLDQSVEKRERIINQADLTLKRNHIHPDKIKLNIQRDEANLNEKNSILKKVRLSWSWDVPSLMLLIY